MIRDIEESQLKERLASRARDAHKGHFGHVLVVGGRPGMLGALLLAGEAAARSGAGCVSIASLDPNPQVLLARRPELMCHAVGQSDDIDPLLEKSTVVVVGPGLGQSDVAEWLLRRVLMARLPTVIDADALNLIAMGRIDIATMPEKLWILTPHPGEAGRLLHSSATEVQADRASAVSALCKKYKAVVVLKGANTLIAGPDVDVLSRVIQGNPGMASGGMGDVLSGVIGGLLAQGLSREEAASLGVYLHAKAADQAAQQLGERGLLAADLMPWLYVGVNP